jgi:hypothetical protein
MLGGNSRQTPRKKRPGGPFSSDANSTTNATQKVRKWYQKFRTGLEKRFIASKVMEWGIVVVI